MKAHFTHKKKKKKYVLQPRNIASQWALVDRGTVTKTLPALTRQKRKLYCSRLQHAKIVERSEECLQSWP
jgi:hypothetical protein